MRTCCLIGAEMCINYAALQDVLLKELREAVAIGGYEKFVVSHNTTFDITAFECLLKLKKEFPHIQIKITFSKSNYEEFRATEKMREEFDKYYRDVEVHTIDLSNVNYKVRPLAFYKTMSVECDYVLCLLNPKDQTSFEYMAIQYLLENNLANACNIYGSVISRPASMEGIVSILEYDCSHRLRKKR